MSQKRRAKELKRRKKLARRKEPPPPPGARLAAQAQLMVEDWEDSQVTVVEDVPEDVVPRLEVPTTSLVGYGIPHWDLCLLFESAGEEAARAAAEDAALEGDDGRTQIMSSPSKQKAYLEPGTATVWEDEGVQRIALVMPDGRTVVREEVVDL